MKLWERIMKLIEKILQVIDNTDDRSVQNEL